MQEFSNSLNNAVESLYDFTPSEIIITRPEDKFGDFSSNIAMQITKHAGKPPRAIAEELSKELHNQENQWLKSVSVEGPGFINILVSDDYIFNSFSLEPNKIYKDKTVIAEYSDPNAFKALHAGHLYTTLVGNAITNILEASGAKVYRLNYGGDVGLHAARAMWGIIHYLGGEFSDKLSTIPETERPIWISARYVEGNTSYETDEQVKQEIIDINKKIYAIHNNNDHESAFAQIYWTCRQWSYDGFIKLYKDIDVTAFDEFIPESLVTPLGVETVEKGLAKGIFEESEGAIIYSETKSGLHTRVFINSRGLPLYEAKELGLSRYKWEKYHFDISLVITANDIVEYMKVLFSAMANFYPEAEQRTTHLAHGMIKFSGGEKMSSRTGNVLMASDIIDSAVKANMASSGKDDRRVAIGAIKYAFLKQRIGGDIMYDPEESISIIGNSGPYLQYAYARACSILAKTSPNTSGVVLVNLDEHERSLAVKLTEYVDSVSKSAADLMPHHICNYLYELAQEFNRFYEISKVIGDERESIRLTLVERYADTLKIGLSILGIDAPEQM